PLAVDLQDFACAVECSGELLAFLGVGRKTRDQRLDLLEQCIAPGVERRSIERRIAVKSFEAVAREHRAKRRRNRHPPLGIETQGVMGHEAVHNAPGSPNAGPVLARGPGPVAPALFAREPGRSAGPLRGRFWAPHLRVGYYGLSWDYLGVKCTVPGVSPRPA